MVGLLWALGGAVVGLIAGGLAAAAIAKIFNVSNREGAVGFFMVGVAIIGAVVGAGAAIAWYARSAPAGQGAAYVGSAVLGVVGLIAVIGLGIWASMTLREAPAMYGGSMANLELEFRANTAEVPAVGLNGWFSVEVQASKTRPEAVMLWEDARTEGAFTVIPAIQGPLYQAGYRVIVLSINGKQDDVFTPPMKRKPNPKADWSEWYRPARVVPPYGVTPAVPLRPLFELRYRVRIYGE